MSEQTSRLAIIIDSTGAERNAESLASALSRMTQAGNKATDGANKVTKATEQESAALTDLLDRIDPVNAALNKLDKQQQQLSKFKAKGFLDDETFAVYSKKIEETRDRLTGFTQQLGKTGQSAAQTANALRMVPAQFTDIVVSLASGQAPLTVLLQQGGQLKDMFGGIGPAIKGLGTYVTGIINPFTLAAAAVGTLGLAYYQGSKEQDEFFKSLTLNGNTLGKTAGQLSDIAASVAQATNSTTGNAAKVLNQIVSSGKVASSSLENVTASVVRMSNATGISTDKLVDDFNKIAENPVEAISKLNDQYHFLTLTTYNQIKALQEQGNEQEAARVANEAYSNSLQRMALDIRNNLGPLESAWESLGEKASKAWDSMLNVGRPQTLQDRLNSAKQQLDAAMKSPGLGNGLWNTYGLNYSTGDVGQARGEVNILQSAISLQNDLTGAISESRREQDKAIKAQQLVNDLTKETLTNAQRRTKEQERLTRAIKDGAKISAEEEKKLRANIDEKYKDPKTPKTKSYRDDAGQRLLMQLQEQRATLVAQENTGFKIGAQQQALIKWEQQLSDLKRKGTLTADQKSLLANADILTKQYQQNAALERQIETAQKALALERARADINRTIANRMSQYSTDEMFAGGGFSQYEQQQYTQRLSLEQSYNDKITQLRQSRASATSDIAREEIDQEIELQRQALDTELRNYDEHIARMNAARGSFSAGANRAWQEYVDSAANVSGMSQQLFTNAFSGMEDALVSFVVHGKASFRDFATSIISDLARIAARQALVGLGSSIFGSLFSAGASAATSASAGQSFAVPSFRPNAKGGVYDSPSLSSYSNGIYNSPQIFAFAKGAGVFGEAGPEAIMPLARGSNGSLGVRAIGASSSAPAINIGDINVEFNGEGQAADTSTQNTVAAAKQLQGIVLKTVTDWAKKEMSPGGVLYRQA